MAQDLERVSRRRRSEQRVHLSIGTKCTTLGALLGFLGTATAIAAGFTNEFRDARQLKPNPEHGRSLYSACAMCHQPDGGGRARAGVPNIAGQPYQVVLEQLVNYREYERSDDRMTPVAAHSIKGPQDLADVAAYIATLPPVATDDTGPGKFLAEGQAIYARACSRCHGVAAEGNGALRFPRLAGQHYSYLTWQIEFMLNGDRMNVSTEHLLLLDALSPDEISGVAGYLSQLKNRE
jgi:cytochrome c553